MHTRLSTLRPGSGFESTLDSTPRTCVSPTFATVINDNISSNNNNHDDDDDDHEMMTGMRDALLPSALTDLNRDMITALPPQNRGSAGAYSRLEK